MAVSREVCYGARILRVGEMAAVIRTFLASFIEEPAPKLCLSRKLADGTGSLIDVLDPASLDEICDFEGYHLWGSFWDKDKQWIQVHFGSSDGAFFLSVDASNPTRLAEVFDHFVSTLSLVETSPPKGEDAISKRIESTEQTLTDLGARLGSIEDTISRIAPGLRCFLSYRFGDANELVALRIQRFLGLLGVDTVTGQGYEPRSVSEKIESRLQSSVHFLVLLIRSDGESFWTRDEIATARARGTIVIPLVEHGASFTPGLFGDLEHVDFAPGHVGDAFLPLLEAIVYVRATLVQAHNGLAERPGT